MDFTDLPRRNKTYYGTKKADSISILRFFGTNMSSRTDGTVKTVPYIGGR